MKTNEVAATTAIDNDNPDTIPLASIEVWGLNPRRDYDGDVTELADSLERGQLHPIILRKRSDGRYDAITGSRRYRAWVHKRGINGVLNRREFRIVDWNDDECIRAVYAENAVREDLSPVMQGTFLNDLAKHYENAGTKATDKVLEDATGMPHQRVNDLRDLTKHLSSLPLKWQSDLKLPVNGRRSSDKKAGDDPAEDVRVITATHWKVVRSLVKKGVTEPLEKIMGRAVTDRWSAARLDVELKKMVTESSESTTSALVQEAGASTEAATVKESPATPKYTLVRKSLLAAIKHCGSDEDLITDIKGVIETVATKLKDKLDQEQAECEQVKNTAGGKHKTKSTKPNDTAQVAA